MRLLFAALLLPLAASKLVAVQLISRHGNRSPNPTLEHLCPADHENRARFAALGVAPAALSGVGMQTMYDLGAFTRRRYLETGFLPKIWADRDVWIQSSYGDRTMASGTAFAQGLYPPGTGSSPPGYDPSLPNPVAIFSVAVTADPLLEVRKGACKATLEKQQDEWAATTGLAIIHQNQELLDHISEACGMNLTDYELRKGPVNMVYAIKDIADSLIFDNAEGFPYLDGLREEAVRQIRALQYKLVYNQLLAKPHSPTFIAGSLPQTLLDNFKRALAGGPSQKLWAYHGHREMLYSLAAYLGLRYDLSHRGITKGALPASGTVFLELHQDDHDPKRRFVRAYAWIPCRDPRKGNRAPQGECDYEPVQFENCATDCPLEQFEELVAAPVRKYGTWEHICNYVPPAQLAARVSELSEENAHLTSSLNLFITLGILAYALAIAIGYFYIKARRQLAEHKYTAIDGIE